MDRAALWQILKFVGVGVLNTVIDLVVLDMLLLLFGVTSGPLYSVFKAIGFLAAVTNSYFMNKWFVFGKERPTRRSSAHESGLFFGMSFIGLLLNTIVSSLAFTALQPISIFSPLFSANAAALVGTLFVFMFNFLSYKFIVFRTPRTT
jgi:putative flippase GtrA